MSEFKRALALMTTTAVIGVGSLAVEQDMSREYRNDLQDCQMKFEDKSERDCRMELGSDHSSTVELLGFISLFGAAAGMVRSFNARPVEPKRPTQQNEQ